uniref:Serpin B6 n=1 Tax=Electrophorus electricus TaxID=8005 RepID=A0AAY5EBV7_ELEEL
MESLSVANTHITLDLFKKIRESNTTDNVFFSPLSISSALAMVLLGAGGNTAAQMSEVRPGNFDMINTTKFSAGFDKLLSELNKARAPYTLSLANHLYGEKSYMFLQVRPLFTEKLTSYQMQRQLQINKWVEQHTHMIQDLLVVGSVDNLTRLDLVNSIYFKGNWENKFKETATVEHPFHLNKVTGKQMMYLKETLPLGFIPDMECQILEMPYVGKELSMLIVLPNEICFFSQLEQELTYENFMEWMRPDMMDVVEVQVAVPRFKLSETYDMKNLLVSMGMADAFDPRRSDFSLMSPCDDLVLSKVVHKSFVEVNEEGTEAAAATAAVLVDCILPLASFVADHPFLFFIQHKPTHTILFSG